MFNFISSLWNRSFWELEKMRRCFVVVIAMTIVGVLLLLFIKPDISQSFYITLAPWLVSAYFLFSIRRLIRFHIAGESFEFLQALSRGMKNFRFESADSAVPAAPPTTPAVPAVPPTTPAVHAAPPTTPAVPVAPAATKTETKEPTGAFDNEFIRFYVSVISNAFLVQTALFLLLPIYINYTVGGKTSIIIILMLLTIIALDNFTSFRRLSRFTVKLAVVAYAIGLVIVLIPQVRFYANHLGADKIINIVPQSTAQLANDIDKLRAKQREEQNNARLREGLEWQKANPGQDLPYVYREKVKEVGRIIPINKTYKPAPVNKPAPEKKLVRVTERKIVQSASQPTSADEYVGKRTEVKLATRLKKRVACNDQMTEYQIQRHRSIYGEDAWR